MCCFLDTRELTKGGNAFDVKKPLSVSSVAGRGWWKSRGGQGGGNGRREKGSKM